MSTLNVANISNGTDTVATGYVVNGSAKAWVNYNPTSATVKDSQNVSSLTDNAVGDTSVNYTSSMSSVNYTQVCGAANSATVSSSNLIARQRSSDFKLVGSTRVNVGFSNSTANYTLFDYPDVSTVIQGDLA